MAKKDTIQGLFLPLSDMDNLGSGGKRQPQKIIYLGELEFLGRRGEGKKLGPVRILILCNIGIRTRGLQIRIEFIRIRTSR